MRIRSVLMIGAAALAVILASPGVAEADVECHVGTPNGNKITNVGPTGSGGVQSRGSANWTLSTKSVSPLSATFYNMASTHCETSWFDWGTQTGHYDARATRNCYRIASGSGAGKTFTETNTGGRTLLGMQKVGACYGKENKAGTCVTNPASHCSLDQVNHEFPNSSTRVWIRNSNGTWTYHSGGDVASA